MLLYVSTTKCGLHIKPISSTAIPGGEENQMDTIRLAAEKQ